MMSGVAFDKIDLSLIRAFHTVITERSVSRAALRLSTSQPAVSGLCSAGGGAELSHRRQ